MITVGYVRELAFIAGIAGTPISTTINFGDLLSIDVKVDNQILSIFFQNELIWEESLDNTVGNFGLESCHRIAEIIKNKYQKLDYGHLIYRKTS